MSARFFEAPRELPSICLERQFGPQLSAIPTGLSPPAQGWPAPAAYPGSQCPNDPTPTGLFRPTLDSGSFPTARGEARGPNRSATTPLGLMPKPYLIPGLLILATLGWRTKSRWDFPR